VAGVACGLFAMEDDLAPADVVWPNCGRC
jgi:hypothetical protein